MAENKPRYSLGSPLVHIKKCEIHDFSIDMICEDCDEFICANCAKTDHRDHDWKTLQTAATERRRCLVNFFRKIKEADLSGINEKMEKMSKQISENKELYDSEINKLQKHCDEIISRVLKAKQNIVQRLKDNLEEKNEKLKSNIFEMDKTCKMKQEIADIATFMEENHSTMSDYSFIDNHRELRKMLSGLDVDMKDCKHSVRYIKGEISDFVLKNMIGNTLDLDDISLTETNTFKYGDNIVFLALCEDLCYIGNIKILLPYTEQVSKEGEIEHTYNITANDVCVTDTSDVYFTNYSNNSISCLSSSGSVSTVISTDPLEPDGICQSVDGGLLITLRDSESDDFKLESHSRRLVRHITVTGDVFHEYEYLAGQEDGHTRLFTLPTRVTQNRNNDICVVNCTSLSASELVIMSPSGRIKSVYRGHNLSVDFYPTDVQCDSLCNILVTDPNNKQIHLLSPDGEFLKFLLTEELWNHPFRLTMYKSALWVGYKEGLVKVFQYR
ncbi:uncharacterized protein LOC134278149 [Saccostrea cucullata]|uniref:uncharacterized protein LOC134278149 n=1 Tax=Saccostrea cuccullata TaxID=36930 RepID=UPI002ED18E28